MSDLIGARDSTYPTERREDPADRTAIGLVLSDYARMAFVFMSAALGPVFVWCLVWIASR
jgi:hypothetical protein